MKEKSFSKKKLITDFLNFDWENYIKTYDDLNLITTKEDAWYHWINYGKHENRVVLKFNTDKSFESFEIFDWKLYINNNDNLSYIDSKEEAWKHWTNHGKNESRLINTLTSRDEYEKFDWESYVSNYDDLLCIGSKEEAWEHWMSHGKNEDRIYENIFLFDDYKTFDWKKYINNYYDLTYIDSENEAWKHFILYGFNEGRKLNDIKETELNEFKKIVEHEESYEEIDYSLNKIYFKKKYTNCGKHFFGWKSSINYLLEHSTFDNLDVKKKYYFDEWIEKLLVWGNKIQNQKCLDTINKENLQLITFLHGPPFENYNSELNKKDLILNDESLLNKNIIELIHKNNLLYSITFLYVLSIDHKNYIINTYPQFKNKVLSLYHPIDINNYEKEDLFSIRKFANTKNIYHIGWWLRNFTSFFNFKVPTGYNKLILLKQEFKQEFKQQFNDIDKNIQIINELDDNNYKKIFSESCIFCDLSDAIANNVVLECIKYNTPIIVRRIPSVEEYLGVKYPLFFTNNSDLIKFTDKKILYRKIIEANEYLKKMDKTPFMLETFLNKTSYDINKLKINNDKYKLTWLYYLNNENDDIEKYISIFNNQLSIQNIKLIIINSLESKIEILERYNNDTITIINIESHLNMTEVYNIFITNSTTEYLIFKKFNNIYTEESYSDLCIHYLENNPTFDVIIFKNNEKIDIKNNEKIYINNNDIQSIDDDTSSQSSDPSLILSESIDKINISNNIILNLHDSKKELETELELELELETEFSEVTQTEFSEVTELENNEDLLTYSQIYNYNFDDQNINILWRKSIHSYINTFDEKFWLECHKNHLNIFEMNYNKIN